MRVALRVGIYVHACLRPRAEVSVPSIRYEDFSPRRKILANRCRSRRYADLSNGSNYTRNSPIPFERNVAIVSATYSVLVRIDTPVRAFIYLDLDLSLLKYPSKFISPRENPSFLISRNVGTRLVILSKSVSFDAHRMNGWHRLRYQSLMRNRSVKAVSLSSFERMHYVVPAASH